MPVHVPLRMHETSRSTLVSNTVCRETLLSDGLYIISLFGRICFPPYPFFSRYGSLVFQLTSEVWKRVMGHVVRKPDVTACENKGAGQPAHSRSLISAFVVHTLKILVDKLATRTNSAFSSQSL